MKLWERMMSILRCSKLEKKCSKIQSRPLILEMVPKLQMSSRKCKM